MFYHLKQIIGIKCVPASTFKVICKVNLMTLEERQILKLAVSFCCSGWMTFAPEWLTGSKNLATDNWLYLWVYLVFFNGLWVVIPLALIYQSWVALASVTRRPSSGTSTKTRAAAEPPSPTTNAGDRSPGDQLRSRGSRRRKQY